MVYPHEEIESTTLSVHLGQWFKGLQNLYHPKNSVVSKEASLLAPTYYSFCLQPHTSKTHLKNQMWLHLVNLFTWNIYIVELKYM